MPKPIPSFANEDEEREFWASHDSTDYVDWSRAERVRAVELSAEDVTKLRSGRIGLRIAR